MKYEKPQKGNPHQLTIHQHCFPRRSIERFCDDTGRVKVHLIEQGKTVSLKPNDPIFCARRAWDQRAESIFMQEIENAYQELANRIEAGALVRRLNATERRVVSDMYSLWNLRWYWKRQPLEDQELVGVLAPSNDYSRDQREMLEKHHVMSVKANGDRVRIPGRHFTGARIQIDLGRIRDELRRCSWGIVRSRVGEFIVPDNSSGKIILPISPTLCFTNREGYGVVSDSALKEMNERSKQESEVFYFGRNL
ncbi:MAG: DUF4238 domain-containing protein [Rhodospirillales bacterium]|nr:DUF4238 domain-containing protein [Rhodospirillales bacterium]